MPVSKLNAAEETIAALQTDIDNLKAALRTKEEELLKLRTENSVMREVFGKR